MTTPLMTDDQIGALADGLSDYLKAQMVSLIDKDGPVQIASTNVMNTIMRNMSGLDLRLATPLVSMLYVKQLLDEAVEHGTNPFDRIKAVRNELYAWLTKAVHEPPGQPPLRAVD